MQNAQNTKDVMKSALFSGILVGMGVVINVMSGNKYIGSMLFSLALLAIIKNQLRLYTGKIGFVTEMNKTEQMNLIPTFIFNIIGILILTLSYACFHEDFCQALIDSAAVKFSHGYGYLLLHGALCGVLMFLAVKSKDMVITVFCIMVFILSGYEHCIAGAPYLVMAFSAENLLKFFTIVLGNSIGSMITYQLMTTKKND